MTLTIATTPAVAMTPGGLLELWSLAFGLHGYPPDTAAAVLQPANLLTVNPLASLLFSDLTLDQHSITNIAGAWTVSQDPTTGIITANAQLSITGTASAVPSGLCIYSSYTETLFIVAPFPTYPPNFGPTYTWNVSIPINSCPA